VATLFVSSGGSNTSPYDTWAKAATSLQTALTAATAGDTVVIQYNEVPSGDAALSADTTYTFPNGIWLVSASNDGGSSYTLTAMGTGNFIGHSSSNRSITFDTGSTNKAKVFVYGITWRISGSVTDNFRIGNSVGNGGAIEFEDCYFWQGNTSSGCAILFTYPNCHVTLVGCTIRSGATGQAIVSASILEMVGCTLSSAGSAPTNLFGGVSGGGNGAVIRATGCDFSHATSNLVADSTTTGGVAVYLERCKLGSGVSPMAAQTAAQSKNIELWLFDCHAGDTHMQFGYYNGLGSLTLDTGIYFTSGAAALSWKVVTTSYCNSRAPFKTPFVPIYHTGTSAITPYFEILRDGSATAYKDSEVWAEFSAKDNSGFTQASIKTDRVALATFVSGGAGSDQANGAGLGSWTGEGGTAWSGKIDSGSSFTPAEVGYLQGRMNFGVASATIYMDPEIRT
jgi:hypothetical protein